MVGATVVVGLTVVGATVVGLVDPLQLKTGGPGSNHFNMIKMTGSKFIRTWDGVGGLATV